MRWQVKGNRVKPHGRRGDRGADRYRQGLVLEHTEGGYLEYASWQTLTWPKM